MSNDVAKMSKFDLIVNCLPIEIQEEVKKTDSYLMKDMKTVLNFKKSITKDGVVDYVSPCGFRYAIRRYDIGELHRMKWNRGTGNFGTILNKLAESSPEFANTIFANINENISERGGERCKQCVSTECTNKEIIEYNGEKKRVCGGSMHFKWLPSEFVDVRKITEAVKEVVKTTNSGV